MNYDYVHQHFALYEFDILYIFFLLYDTFSVIPKAFYANGKHIVHLCIHVVKFFILIIHLWHAMECYFLPLLFDTYGFFILLFEPCTQFNTVVTFLTTTLPHQNLNEISWLRLLAVCLMSLKYIHNFNFYMIHFSVIP